MGEAQVIGCVALYYLQLAATKVCLNSAKLTVEYYPRHVMFRTNLLLSFLCRSSLCILTISELLLFFFGELRKPWALACPG